MANPFFDVTKITDNEIKIIQDGGQLIILGENILKTKPDANKR